jgi:AhpD family alkylhydroperoxidase
MVPRINFYKVAPDAVAAMRGLEHAVNQSGLEASLRELVKLRVSQLNGCAYCIDMHSKEARAACETEQRIYALNAWRETPFFSERERAALDWAEKITNIGVDHAPDDVFFHLRRFFGEAELVNLTLAIVAINGWNRLAIAFRSVPGSYQAKTAADV